MRRGGVANRKSEGEVSMWSISVQPCSFWSFISIFTRPFFCVRWNRNKIYTQRLVTGISQGTGLRNNLNIIDRILLDDVSKGERAQIQRRVQLRAFAI